MYHNFVKIIVIEVFDIYVPVNYSEYYPWHYSFKNILTGDIYVFTLLTMAFKEENICISLGNYPNSSELFSAAA